MQSRKRGSRDEKSSGILLTFCKNPGGRVCTCTDFASIFGLHKPFACQNSDLCCSGGFKL